MAGDLSGGCIPPYYREIYDIVCPNQEQVDQNIFLNLLVKSSLPKATLMQIWDAVDNKTGFLSRNGLYKALAFTALAQQGKTINDKMLDTFADSELPRPVLGDLSDLKALSMRTRRKNNPNVLGYTYNELRDLDTVRVSLIPEKKGLILKHVEYEVSSQRYKTTVLRRYTDFVVFFDHLIQRYPYRLIPRLPPKKMNTSREFIEHRRKCLNRFVTLVVRHPIMADDRLIKFFLTFTGSDMHHKIKDHFRGMPDEFMSSEIALNAKDLVPMDTQLQLNHAREHVRVLYASTSTLRNIADRLVSRSVGYASDMLQLGQELSVMGHDDTPVSTWQSGANETWAFLKIGFKKLSADFATIADKSQIQAGSLQEGVLEKLNLFLDLINAHKDLCERHEKGVLSDHQRALQKMGQYKKKRMTATLQQSSESGQVEQLESRILQQESQISNMENRNYFSLHCLQMESQLIHANLEMLYHTLNSIVDIECHSHRELMTAWESIRPSMENFLPGMTRNGINSGSTPSSPIGSPPPPFKPGITV